MVREDVGLEGVAWIGVYEAGHGPAVELMNLRVSLHVVSLLTSWATVSATDLVLSPSVVSRSACGCCFKIFRITYLRFQLQLLALQRKVTVPLTDPTWEVCEWLWPFGPAVCANRSAPCDSARGHLVSGRDWWVTAAWLWLKCAVRTGPFWWRVGGGVLSVMWDKAATSVLLSWLPAAHGRVQKLAVCRVFLPCSPVTFTQYFP